MNCICAGKSIFSCLQQQYSFVETKSENYKFIEELKTFMSHKRAICDLNNECGSTCIMLVEVMNSKEDKLRYQSMIKIRHCMDAMTTSPVDSKTWVAISTFKYEFG